MIFLYLAILICLIHILSFGTVSSALGVGQCLVFISDSSSYIFIVTLCSISGSVLFWSYFYIDSESSYRRFCCLVLLFLVSIFTLVFSADLLSLFVAWDLLGFTSLFLVIFYGSRASISGGLVTGLTNRLGDVFLLSFFGLRFYGSCSTLSTNYFILFLISFTKSAQVPFSSWLPAAMSAPTPVSALVHSSTLVTAGVYLLYRYAPSESAVLCWVGIGTTLVAGIGARLECDIKKVIALSTLSQLGLIVSALGLGERSLCFAHLNTHAAFKALLFLAVGTVIHSIYSSQEARLVFPLYYASPLGLVVAVTSCLSMCGFVFLSGWVTKEAVLFACYNGSQGLAALVFFYVGIGLTVCYSLRLLLILSAHHSHSPSFTPSYSCSFFVKLPFLMLLLSTVFQGSLLNLNCIYQPSFQCFEDSLFVWCVFIVSC